MSEGESVGFQNKLTFHSQSQIPSALYGDQENRLKKASQKC